MLWIKALHIIAVICWFAGLFYLPRLFVYHSMAEDTVSQERFKLMERKLYYGIMMPSAILAIFFGAWLISYQPQFYLTQHWMQAKLVGVLGLIIFQLYCNTLRLAFKQNRNRHSHQFYRWINEIPTLLLIIIVILVVVKPF